jgi:hypothetical protein
MHFHGWPVWPVFHCFLAEKKVKKEKIIISFEEGRKTK